MFEDELSSGSATDELVSDTIKDTREKLERAIIKFAYISQERDDTYKRLHELYRQAEDAHREVERLQEAHVELIANKIRSN